MSLSPATLATIGVPASGGVFVEAVNNLEVVTPVDVPNASVTVVTGENAAGQLVGSYNDTSGTHGFVYANGQFTTVNVPGATSTEVVGINNLGQLVGDYTESGSIGAHGFLYADGTYQAVNIPEATSVMPVEITDQGVISGFYSDSSSNSHAFSLQVPGGGVPAASVALPPGASVTILSDLVPPVSMATETISSSSSSGISVLQVTNVEAVSNVSMSTMVVNT